MRFLPLHPPALPANGGEYPREERNVDSRCTRATFRLPSIRAEIKSSASGARATILAEKRSRAIGGSDARAGLLITGGGIVGEDRFLHDVTAAIDELFTARNLCELHRGSAPDVTENRSVGGSGI